MSRVRTNPDEIAEQLLASPQGRGNEALFVMVARVWYAERDERCCRPAFSLVRFGRALGLAQTSHLKQRAEYHVQTQRRARMGGRPVELSSGGKLAWWITESGERVST